MSTALLLFPHQLFDPLPPALRQLPIYLLEDSLFFADARYPARFHVQRLLFHRASLLAYADQLQRQGNTVVHWRYAADLSLQDRLQILKDQGVHSLHLLDPVDFMLEKRLNRAAARCQLQLRLHDSPAFLNPRTAAEQLPRRGGRYSQTQFYIAQRQQRGLLLTDAGGPVGGKWSFDPDNRKKLPKGHQVPAVSAAPDSPWLQQARTELRGQFAEAWGQADTFLWPVTHSAARRWLGQFLAQRLSGFGDYEDAMAQQEDFVYHSLLSPLLNSGLLTPAEVLQQTLDYAAAHPVPLNALEGFVRQIVGWREYLRLMYVHAGVAMRTRNYWGHTRPMPRAFYDASTGLLPADHVIQKAQRLAYAHHIERLMVLGNLMLLCEIHPDAIYTWFMEAFIDSYDWVMVPNVYAMSQYADGGTMTTKPYLSGSSYLRRMSDFAPGPWCAVWDGLYWRFVYKHRDFFRSNPRLAVMDHQLERMGPDKLQAHLSVAEGWLERLFAAG